MERFILVEYFQKKGNTFRGISSFSLQPEFPEISIPFVHTYKCQSPPGNISEKKCLRSEKWRQISKTFIVTICVFARR